MVRNKSLPIVSISDITVGYRTSLWRYMTKLSYMNKLYDIRWEVVSNETYRNRISQIRHLCGR
mgnify:CR=1 FL=1